MIQSYISQAIGNLNPDSAWSIVGDDLTTLTWLDKKQIHSTSAEITVEATRLQTADNDEAVRAASMKADSGRTDLINRLKTATPAQIDTWVDNNVTTLVAARTLFKAIIKVLALDQRS